VRIPTSPPGRITAALGTNGLVYTSEPLADPALVAGNPFAFLRVTSDHPDGIFSVALVDLGPGFGCDATGIPVDAAQLAVGGADLRFHQGNMVAVDFPTGTPVQTRVDFPNFAHVLEAGHRLAVVIGPAGDGLTAARWRATSCCRS
jgi:predicted acyl esterase